MESLIKQTRLRFASKTEERSSTTDRKIQPQKTQSFRERKKSQSWVKRQFSRQMSWDYDFSSSEYPAAVAAAAYAIQSLEESKYWDEREKSYGPDKSLRKMKSKVDDTGEKPEPFKSALKSLDETSNRSFKDSESASTSKKMPERERSLRKQISFADPIDDTTSKKPERLPSDKAPERAPSLKKHSSFADKPETTLPKPDRPPTRQPSTKPGPGDSLADAWEKEEMASIKERYEKLRATIDNWEKKKKKKAKRKTERIEFQEGPDRKREKTVQKYRSDIARIESIAGGARAQAEENRRNEELKVKEKANKIRATGKLPPTCLCF